MCWQNKTLPVLVKSLVDVWFCLIIVKHGLIKENFTYALGFNEKARFDAFFNSLTENLIIRKNLLNDFFFDNRCFNLSKKLPTQQSCVFF